MGKLREAGASQATTGTELVGLPGNDWATTMAAFIRVLDAHYFGGFLVLVYLDRRNEASAVLTVLTLKFRAKQDFFDNILIDSHL
jgi:hypothetical protein